MLGVGFFVLLMKFILNEGNGNIIPSRWQSLVEGIYNFMMETIQQRRTTWSGVLPVRLCTVCVLALRQPGWNGTLQFHGNQSLDCDPVLLIDGLRWSDHHPDS